MIGGTAPGTGNTIAFNLGSAGVRIFNAGVGNSILGNSIHSNSSRGIDLIGDGVTPNDPGDADTGENNLQNFPVLTAATVGATDATVEGTLNSVADTTFRVEFFSNAAADSSGFGEGQTFLGFTEVTTDVGGNANIFVTLPVAVAAGEFITSTATRLDGPGDPIETSEFSATVEAEPEPIPAVTTTADSGPGSLRAAIIAANTTANVGGNPDRIEFNIAGGQVHTINLLSALPTITESLIIDGFTQTDASENTNPTTMSSNAEI